MDNSARNVAAGREGAAAGSPDQDGSDEQKCLAQSNKSVGGAKRLKHERGEPILARDHRPDSGHDQKNQEHPLLDLVDTNLQSLSNRNAFGTTSSVETSEITRQRPFLRGQPACARPDALKRFLFQAKSPLKPFGLSLARLSGHTELAR